MTMCRKCEKFSWKAVLPSNKLKLRFQKANCRVNESLKHFRFLACCHRQTRSGNVFSRLVRCRFIGFIKKCWISSACSILRNNIWMFRFYLVYDMTLGVEELELLRNMTCLLIQRRTQHFWTTFRCALFV